MSVRLVGWRDASNPTLRLLHAHLSPALSPEYREEGVGRYADRMTVTKAVIPAAGLGTRMLPAAKAVAKELLPVLDKPAIQYVLEEAAAGGITDVLLISSPAKRAVEKHFQLDPELEKRVNSRRSEEHTSELQSLAYL